MNRQMISNYLSKVKDFRLSATTLTFVVLGAVIILGALVTWFVVYTHTNQTRDDARANHPLRVVGGEVASSTLYDQQGNQTSLASYAENWTVVTSWATWCPACQLQLEHVANLAQAYSDRGVVAIAYNRIEPPHVIEAFTTANPPPENLILIRDSTDELYRQLDGTTMPETVIISPDGEVVYHFKGPVSERKLREALEVALSQ
jgi:thiol-disulfide isomerase/thioredoxin